MGRPSEGKWVQDKIYLIQGREDCYIYKRPGSSVWQYYLSIPGEGEERKSTKKRDQKEAIDFAMDRKLEVMSRQKQGLKARRVKRMFDFIDDYLAEEKKRISPYNRKGFITQETFRVKSHHLNLLRKFYKDKNIKLEDLDYPKIFEYPTWRQTITCDLLNPIAIQPPKTSQTIASELTTIKAYFGFLHLKGYIPSVPLFAKVQRESLKVNRRDFLNEREYKQTLNTIRSWANSAKCTPSQSYNRKMLYQAILIMTNACLRPGELRGLKWVDIEPNTNLDKEDQKIGHLIRIREDNTKVGEPRTVQTPTTKRFDEVRKLQNLPKVKGRPFPSVSTELKNQLVFTKFNHPEQPLGQGTWDRCWKEIKELCADRYWNNKNITWYSFRHTGISFNVARGVPMLLLTRNCGTGHKYVSDVYYHHESESKKTWETLNQNRVFSEKMAQHKEDMLVEMEEVLEQVDID